MAYNNYFPTYYPYGQQMPIQGSQNPSGSSEEYVPRNEYEEFKEDIRRALRGIRRPSKETLEEAEG